MKASNKVTNRKSVSYNKSLVMKRAWKLYKAQDIKTMEVFADCMRESWNVEKNGIKLTIDAIYNKHYKQVLNWVNFKIHNMVAAEEIAADVFIKVNEHLLNYDVYKANLNTWIFKIANNKVIDYYRQTEQRKKTVNVSDYSDDNGKETFDFVAESESAESSIISYELNTAIDKAFNTLKPKYKEIADLYFKDQKSYEEISKICNVPMGTVKGMINRCRAKLQEQLQNVY